jgi:hypothetical protein
MVKKSETTTLGLDTMRMPSSLARWCEFKIKKLQVIREQYQTQVKTLTEEMNDIDYEIALLTDAMNEATFDGEFIPH